MMLDRRTFLAQAAAAPLLFGLEELLAQEPAKSPEWFAAALKKMKETGRCGVAIVAPEKDDEQIALGTALYGIIQSRNSEVHELLCEGVFICLTPKLARARVRKDGETENVFLLDPEGKRLASTSVVDAGMKEPAGFVKHFGSLLHGADDARLKEKAQAIGQRLTPGQKAALEELGAYDLHIREQATLLLAASADMLVPYLVWLKRTDSNLERRRRAGALIEGLFSRNCFPSNGYRLPYGTLPDLGRGGDPCPWCGMAQLTVRDLKFLRFLTE